MKHNDAIQICLTIDQNVVNYTEHSISRCEIDYGYAKVLIDCGVITPITTINHEFKAMQDSGAMVGANISSIEVIIEEYTAILGVVTNKNLPLIFSKDVAIHERIKLGNEIEGCAITISNQHNIPENIQIERSGISLYVVFVSNTKVVDLALTSNGLLKKKGLTGITVNSTGAELTVGGCLELLADELRRRIANMEKSMLFSKKLLALYQLEK